MAPNLEIERKFARVQRRRRWRRWRRWLVQRQIAVVDFSDAFLHLFCVKKVAEKLKCHHEVDERGAQSKEADAEIHPSLVEPRCRIVANCRFDAEVNAFADEKDATEKRGDRQDEAGHLQSINICAHN